MSNPSLPYKGGGSQHQKKNEIYQTHHINTHTHIVE